MTKRTYLSVVLGIFLAFLTLGAVLYITTGKTSAAAPTYKADKMNTLNPVMTVIGTRQGTFKSSNKVAGQTNKFALISFESSITSPRDATTGAATGKRQHNPITVLKQIDAGSPQFLQAACTNEVLKSVLFEFVRVTDEGAEEIYHTIKLTNASVSARNIVTHATNGGIYEEVSFTYQTIEEEDKNGRTMASDSWSK